MMKIELKVITRELREPCLGIFINLKNKQNHPVNSSDEYALFPKGNNVITRSATPLRVCAVIRLFRCHNTNITQALLHNLDVWFLTMNFKWRQKCQPTQ